MEKEFVPYKLAVKLKELGFDEECFAYYRTKYGLEHPDKSLQGCFYASEGHKIPTCKSNNNDRLGAPLWQQAFDWCLDNIKFDYAIRFIQTDNDCFSLVNYEEEIIIWRVPRINCLEKLIELSSC